MAAKVRAGKMPIPFGISGFTPVFCACIAMKNR
jgi:hypothetical protein